MTGTRIFTGVQVGGGLLLHTSVGIVITKKAVIGENCTFFSGASLIHKANGLGQGAPIVGNNVKLMAGCKVIGPVTIGDNAVIAANAVVLCDIPADSLAVGIPAVVKEKTYGNT
jgi:serine O-acetyltransferase